MTNQVGLLSLHSDRLGRSSRAVVSAQYIVVTDHVRLLFMHVH